MPAFFHNVLFRLVLMLGMGLGFVSAVYAETVPASAEAVEKLQDRVIELEKETAVLKAELGTRIDAQDNRIADGIGLHGAKVTELSNQTSMLGVFITVLTALIAVVGIFGGVFAFKRAEQIAKEQSEQWFKENDAKLREEIDRLKAEAQRACDSIDGHTSIVDAKAQDAILGIKKRLEEVTNPAKEEVGNKERRASLGEIRSMWTADDWFTEGDELYSRQDFQGAINAWGASIRMLEGLNLEHDIESSLRLNNAKIKKLKTSYDLELLNKLTAKCESQRKIFNQEPSLQNGKLFIKLTSEMAATMAQLGMLSDSVSKYTEIIDQFDAHSRSDFRADVILALSEKRRILEDMGLWSDAIKASETVISRLQGSHGLSNGVVRQTLATELLSKSFNFYKMGQLKDSISECTNLISHFAGDYSEVLETLTVAKDFHEFLLSKEGSE